MSSASQTLQRAIARANDEQLMSLARGLLAPRHLQTALTDKYASHVVEALLEHSAREPAALTRWVGRGWCKRVRHAAESNARNGGGADLRTR